MVNVGEIYICIYIYIHIYKFHCNSLEVFQKGTSKNDPKLNFWILMRDRNQKTKVPKGVMVCHGFETKSYQKAVKTFRNWWIYGSFTCQKWTEALNNTLPNWIKFCRFWSWQFVFQASSAGCRHHRYHRNVDAGTGTGTSNDHVAGQKGVTL